MKIDVRIKTYGCSGGYKRVRLQKTFAPRKGVSSYGTPYKKGAEILHCQSGRATGETFVFTQGDLYLLFNALPGKWHSPTLWEKRSSLAYRARMIKTGTWLPINEEYWKNLFNLKTK